MRIMVKPRTWRPLPFFARTIPPPSRSCPYRSYAAVWSKADSHSFLLLLFRAFFYLYVCVVCILPLLSSRFLLAPVVSSIALSFRLCRPYFFELSPFLRCPEIVIHARHPKLSLPFSSPQGPQMASLFIAAAYIEYLVSFTSSSVLSQYDPTLKRTNPHSHQRFRSHL
ncbi:hypothetical protein BC939DRAFT_467856 [Gamsiella multidivaricata]|uniref:uncharacterized protein n=1 Tax=Gamsiella multidivaricata TaxID=101098 RepID=UPI002221088F|nr:uncharacterized protein BC939DRAFT_467856 [Gamsiella multidivaricata]KAI7816780.1 hypothetical protein BC939DRAFT_467856 [Gamsiella multidivaricata]